MNQPNWPLSEDSRPSYSDDDVDFSQETHQRAQMQYSHLNAGILPLMETQQQNDEATIPLNALYFEQTALDVDDDDGSSMPAYIGSDIDDYDEGIAVYNAQMNNPELTFHVLDEDDDAPDAFNNESLEPAEYLSEIITDAEYADWIGIRWTGEFPFSENIDEDLRALVLGALMAKGENIDCGYEIEQFDALLQEVTGRRLDVVCDFISLSSLACFLSLSPEEEKKIKHAKINVLLHDTFKDFVQYNTADGNVKVKIPPVLVDLYETLKKTESTRVKRKEQAEKAKNDVMNNPANRRRYMITNNLLVELIVMARNTNFETEISWNHIRDEYREMMETKNALYQRYCKLLNLEKVFEIGKYELNEASTRELFGRSSITKALSVPLFRKIRIGNDTKRNLVLSLTESDPKDCLYKQEEFAAIDAEIKKHEVVMCDQMKKKEEMVRNQHKEYKIAEARKKKEVNQARRARELEERKKDYIPVALDEVYVPGGDETSAAEDRRPVVSESNCGFQFQQPIVLEPRRPDAFQKSLIGGIRVSPDTTNESIVPSTDQIEELEYGGNIFGNVESNAINLSDVSSISDEVTQSAPDFTDEEGKEPVSRHLPSRAEQRTSTPINNQWDAPKQPQPKECCPSQQSSEKQRAPRPSPLPQHPTKETRVDNHSQMSNRPRRQFPPMQSSRPDISNCSFTTAPREQSTMRMYPNSSLTAEQYNQPNLFRSPRYAPESNTTTLARDVLNVNEMQPQELFVQYLTLHVFVHRKITGAPQRFWSQIQRHLPLPLNRPEFIFGPNWITELSNISHGLEIIRVRNDLLFEWKDDHFNMSTNFSESSH